MAKRKSLPPPLPKPTSKIYPSYAYVFWVEGRRDQKPEPLPTTLTGLLTDSKNPCYITIRTNLRLNKSERRFRNDSWKEHGRIRFPHCEGAVNYPNYMKLWEGRTFLCDMSVHKNRGEEEWFVIDYRGSDKVIGRIEWSEGCPRFTEVDKIGHNRHFFFDGTFTDLLHALHKEGFCVEE